MAQTKSAKAKQAKIPIDWGSIHLKYSKKLENIVFGKTYTNGDSLVFAAKSGGRFEEVVFALSDCFRDKMAKRDAKLAAKKQPEKHFFGYDTGNGKIVLIEDGYDFKIISPIESYAEDLKNSNK